MENKPAFTTPEIVCILSLIIIMLITVVILVMEAIKL